MLLIGVSIRGFLGDYGTEAAAKHIVGLLKKGTEKQKY